MIGEGSGNAYTREPSRSHAFGNLMSSKVQGKGFGLLRANLSFYVRVPFHVPAFPVLKAKCEGWEMFAGLFWLKEMCPQDI